MRQYLAEMVRAGLVLALLLFAFAGVTAPQQVGASPAVAASIAQTAASDLCGGGWGDRLAAHAPCHACRSGVPVLPTPPCTGEPIFRDILNVAYGLAAPAYVLIGPPPRPLSRGPPVLA